MTSALRLFSLAFLGWHLGLLFPGLADPWVPAAAALVGWALGNLGRNLRGPVALAAGAAAALVLGLGLDLVPWAAGDPWALWVDRHRVFALGPWVLGAFEGWAFADQGRWRGWERLVNALAAAALFWTQGPYHVTLYPHPLGLALAWGLFLASEVTLAAGVRFLGRRPLAALGAAVLALGLLWGLWNRYEDQSTASGGGLMKPDLFRFDFAPLVRLEDQISLGQDLVLLYREEGPAQTRYLRRFVLENYDPAQGFSLGTHEAPVVGRKPKTWPGDLGTQERIPVRQEYYLVNLDPSSLLALNDPRAVTPYAQWDKSSFVNAYRVDSQVSTEAFWLYAEAKDDGLDPDRRRALLRGGDDPELRALARAWTAEAKTPFEQAMALQSELKRHYTYSLRPGAPGPRGALKHFLFEAKKGYCSYFAFSMTLLLRSLGVPARVAVGFVTSPDQAVMGFQPVRAFQAHAWVEVPFGPYGWLEFDPTSDVPTPGEEFDQPKPEDPDRLAKMIAEILGAQPQPLNVEEASKDEGDEPQTGGPAVQVWIAVLAALGLLVQEVYRRRWLVGRWASRTRRRRVWWAWREVRFWARRAGLAPAQGQTPEAWAAGLPEARSEAQEWARTLARLRYGPAEPTAPETAAFEAQTARLVRRLKNTLPRPRRVLYLLAPWWPR